MQGYVPLYRHILDSCIATNASLLGVYTHLMLKANHTSAVFYIGSVRVSLEPGQLVTSQKKLAEHFNVSISTIHARLKILAKEKMISLTSNNKFTLITCLYREQKETKENRSGKETETKPKSKQNPTKSQPKPNGNLAETNNNDNNDKNEESGSSQKSLQPLIKKLKQTAEQLNIVYDGNQQYHYAALLTKDDEFRKLCEKQCMSSVVMASEIMRQSATIKFRKGTCAGPKDVYLSFAEVANKTQQLQVSEIDHFIAQQPDDIEEKLKQIKKTRKQQYPYKAPFASVSQISDIIEAIKVGKL